MSFKSKNSERYSLGPAQAAQQPVSLVARLRAGLPRLSRSPYWLERALPVVGTMCFEILDVGSDVATYVRVVASSAILGPSFKVGYLTWCCVSVVASSVALAWYLRSLLLGYLDYKHNILSSTSRTGTVTQEAVNVVAIKSRLQVSMLLVVVEDLPSVALNG
jgi:hypothetical protein